MNISPAPTNSPPGLINTNKPNSNTAEAAAAAAAGRAAYLQKAAAKSKVGGGKDKLQQQLQAQDNKLSQAKKPKKQGILLEMQGTAPPPNNTLYHFQIHSNNRVVLMDWPKQRLSQKWTREGGMNPNSTIVNFEDFIGGELKDELSRIFGKEFYEKAFGIVKEAYED